MAAPRSTDSRFEELREIVAEVLELDPHDVLDAADFQREYDADSLRAIEILSRMEKKYGVEIPQVELPKIRTLESVYDLLARYSELQEKAQ